MGPSGIGWNGPVERAVAKSRAASCVMEHGRLRRELVEREGGLGVRGADESEGAVGLGVVVG
jgi:hypothetical protein